MNAKEELIEILKNKARIKCADYILEGNSRIISGELCCDYSEIEYERFLDKLNFDYINNKTKEYENLKGVVWLEDGTWLERVTIKKINIWKHETVPEIPEHLK